jgi:hypothetical protein
LELDNTKISYKPKNADNEESVGWLEASTEMETAFFLFFFSDGEIGISVVTFLYIDLSSCRKYLTGSVQPFFQWI